jgi:hypothetical protein
MAFLTQLVFSQSVFYQAAQFDGGSFIVVPDDSSLKLADEVTLSAWVKRQQLESIDFILEKGGDWNIGFTNYGFSLHYINNHMFYFIYRGGWRGTSGVTDLEWHHYAVVARHGESNPTFFIDGEIKPVEFSSGSAQINLYSITTENLNIGAQLNPGATHYSSNIIDEIRIWNFGRDSLEIVTSMLDTLNPPVYLDSSSGLVGYWRMDEFEDLGVNNDGTDDFRDLSIYNNNADAEGNIVLTSFVTSKAPDYKTLNARNYYLSQNYPNPFNPSTTIEFTLPKSEFVELKVYNILGKKVATLVSKKLNPGNHIYQFDGKDLASGVYYYRLESGVYQDVKKMILIK